MYTYVKLCLMDFEVIGRTDKQDSVFMKSEVQVSPICLLASILRSIVEDLFPQIP